MVDDEKVVQERVKGNRYGSFDYDFLVMRAFDKARLTGSVEFRGGYWEERESVVNGQVVTEKFYVPDTRRTFINSIRVCHTLLVPSHDEEYEEAVKKIEERIGELKQNRDDALGDLGDGKGAEQDKIINDYYQAVVELKFAQFTELMHLLQRMGLLGMKAIQEIIDPEADY